MMGALAFWKPRPPVQAAMFEADKPIGGHLRKNGTYVRGHRGRRRSKAEPAPAAAPPVDLLNQLPQVEDPVITARRATLEWMLRRHGGIENIRAMMALAQPDGVRRMLAGMANIAGCTVAEIEKVLGLEGDFGDALPPQE